MQPTLAVSAPVAGVVYLNGRFAGECAADAPLFFPAAPRGAHYLEYRPLERGAVPLARRLVLAEGRPMAAPEDVFCVCWPGGVVEVKLACEETPRVRWGNAELPPGAGKPEEEAPLEGGTLLLGRFGAQRYAATLDAEGTLNGFVRFDALRGREGDNLLCLTDRGDAVGHALLEHWQASGAGFRLLSSENAWAHGAPRWPQSEEGTALAACEAALLGLSGEADGYLAPEKRGQNFVGTLISGANACGKVKYAPPDAHGAVALFFPIDERLTQVRCARFRGVPAGGTQGPWQIAAMWMEA